MKEQSALLNVDGNNLEEIFELSAVSQKIENYLNAKKQLRYDKDQKEQAEREKVAAAEFLNFIENDEKFKRFPVVVMDESTFSRNRSKVSNSIAKGFVTKPTFSNNDFNFLKDILGKRF